MGENFYTRTDPITGFAKQVVVPDTVQANLQFAAFNKIFNGSSFSLGTTYRVDDYISLKANIARGFRAPSISEFASNGLDPGAHIVYLGNRNFLPEFSLQEDIGANAVYKNISTTLSFFNNNIQNYIYNAQLTDAHGNPVTIVPGNKTFQYQQSTAQLFGFELDLLITPAALKGFSVSNSFSWIEGYNRNPKYKNMGINGEYLPFMPPMHLLSSIRQEIGFKSRLVSSIIVKADGDFNASQNRFMALYNTETATPGYCVFNFGIISGIRYTKNAVLQFQFQVNNAFDQAYQSGLSRLKYFDYYSVSPNGHLGIYNMGRNICLKLIVPF